MQELEQHINSEKNGDEADEGEDGEDGEENLLKGFSQKQVERIEKIVQQVQQKFEADQEERNVEIENELNQREQEIQLLKKNVADLNKKDKNAHMIALRAELEEAKRENEELRGALQQYAEMIEGQGEGDEEQEGEEGEEEQEGQEEQQEEEEEEEE